MITKIRKILKSLQYPQKQMEITVIYKTNTLRLHDDLSKEVDDDVSKITDNTNKGNTNSMSVSLPSFITVRNADSHTTMTPNELSNFFYYTDGILIGPLLLPLCVLNIFVESDVVCKRV